MHEVMKRKAGKAQTLRVPNSTWDSECDLACIFGYILSKTHDYRDPDNTIVFEGATIKSLINNFVEGSPCTS